MTGHGIGLDTDLGHPNAVRGHRSNQHHGLGIGGQRQGFLGAFLDQLGNVFTQGLRGFLQGLDDDRMRAPTVEHADGLRALAREYKCKFFHGNFLVGARDKPSLTGR